MMTNPESRTVNTALRAPHAAPRAKAVWGGRALLGAAVLIAVVAAILIAGCSQVRNSQASSYLVITTLQGGAGTAGAFGGVLDSDVISDTGSIAADRGQAALLLQMKDATGLAPSPNNSITLTQYHVEYVRADGRNTQGVDVPYAFDGAVTATVSSTATVVFTLVRIQAKLEPPLASLVHHGGAQAITTIAKVTFYGHDQTGREVSVTGNIEVDFADWAG